MTVPSAPSPAASRSTGRRLALAVVGVTLAGSVFLADAGGAATSWSGFGGGTATGRGSYGYPHVSVDSTTRRNPEAVRFQVTGSDVRARISWHLSCWDEANFDYDSASGSFSARLPYTRDVSRSVGVARYDYCSLDVSAYYLDPAKIRVSLQARYS